MHPLIVALHRPNKPTGICRHAANLAQALAGLDKITQVTLVIGGWQKHYFENAFSLTSPKIRLKIIEIENDSLTRNIWFLFGLPQLVKQFHPDIVHLSFPLPIIRNLFSCPIVATIHDLYPHECPKNFGNKQVLFNRLFLNQCIHQSDVLACVSKTTMQNLQDYFPHLNDKKVTVIYNIIDFGNTTPLLPAELKTSSNDSFLLAVAQHRKNKNLDLLIQAFSQVLQRQQIDPSSKLIIVGSTGPETERLSELITQVAVNEQVLFISSLKDAELLWLYQNCDLFAVTSSTEGFCLPLAEALSFSCKVVCSKIPILEEIGLENCTYFELQDKPISNLYNAIIEVLRKRHPALSKRDKRFSISTIAEQYINLYEDVLNAASHQNIAAIELLNSLTAEKNWLFRIFRGSC